VLPHIETSSQRVADTQRSFGTYSGSVIAFVCPTSWCPHLHGSREKTSSDHRRG